MKTVMAAVTAVTLLAIVPLGVSAQTMKPGLWEVKTSLGKGYGKSMAAIAANNRKMVAAMSAESRKELAAMEAENNISYTDDHMIMKACLTKAQVAKVDKMLSPKGDCTEQRSPFVGGVMKMTYSCRDPQSTGSGTLRFQGDTGFAMDMTTITTVQGQRFDNKANVVGKWLGQDCGKIEPDTAED